MKSGGSEMLDFDYVDWDDDDVPDPENNVGHIAAAGLTPEEVNEVLYSPDPDTDTSDSSGVPRSSVGRPRGGISWSFTSLMKRAESS
jgi:hypothetical protein